MQLVQERCLLHRRVFPLTMVKRFYWTGGVEIPQMLIWITIPQSLICLQLVQERYLPHRIVPQLTMVKITMILTTLFYFIAVTQATNITMSKFSGDLFLLGKPNNFEAPTKH